MNIREYMKQRPQIGQYGIRYLDNRLKGIYINDLILIGARSGAGKSTISLNIALANPHIPVKLFSLENFKDDDWAFEVYKQYKLITGRKFLHQRDFTSGNFDINEDALDEAEKKANEKFKHINISSRQKDFNIKKLKEEMVSAVRDNGIKLLIIDHLDYLDKDTPNDNDITHMTALMKQIRYVQDNYPCAIIAISHLRKNSSGRELPAVPSMDEFHGSSNKVKEATAVIMLAPDDKTNENSAGGTKRATWCCVRKLRFGGIDNTTARLYFDTNINNYIDSYEVCSVNYTGTEVNLIKQVK